MKANNFALGVCALADFIVCGECFLLNSTSNIAESTQDTKNTRQLLETEMSALKGRLEAMETDYFKEKQQEIIRTQYLLDRYIVLENKFTNITQQHKQLESNFEVLLTKFTNLTQERKQLESSTEVLKIENNKLKDRLNNVSEQLDIQTTRYNMLTERYSFLSNKTMDDYLKTNNKFNNIYETMSNITSVVSQTDKRLEKYEMQLGFTVRAVNKASSTNDLLKFERVVFNENNVYNMNTGVFVCQIPGIYFFALNIVREPGIKQSYCFIYVNNDAKTGTVGWGSTTDGYSSGTTTLVYHLRVGDRVYLSYCEGIDHMYGTSSFSGFLIKPDR